MSQENPPIFFFANPYDARVTYELHIRPPTNYDKNFFQFRSIIDNLAPFRQNTTIRYNENNQRELLFLVEGSKQVARLCQEIKKHIKGVKLTVIPPTK
jgi:hypothetical protein